jgi:hypothetical protein
MGSLRKLFGKALVNKILNRVPAILGCILFVSSFISPFYLIRFSYGASTSYWSFKSEYHADTLHITRSGKTWFSDYWFNIYQVSVGLRQPETLITLFTIQVLTLIFGIVSIFFRRRIPSFIPVLLSVLVLGLMIYTNNLMFGSGEYQLGYYLIYPSLAIFLSAFVLNEVTRTNVCEGKSRRRKELGDLPFSHTAMENY